MANSACPGCQGETRRPHDSNELRKHHPNSNPSCPACMEFRRHTEEEYRTHHSEREQTAGTVSRDEPDAKTPPSGAH